jgi:hypothetical protein
MTLKVPVRRALFAILCVGCASVTVWSQDSQAPGASLGDLARQTRAQHDSNDSKSSKAQELVDEMQAEQEASDAAPTGFKDYDAGDYWLFVPYPFSLEGRENGGAVLLGSRLGITNTEVMAGTAIPIPAGFSDNDVANMVRQLAETHGRYSFCSPTKLGSRKAFHCYWNDTPWLLGHEVWGTMEFVVGSSSVIPVMCVSPDEFQCLNSDRFGYHTCQNKNPSWQEVQQTKADIATRFRDEITTAQMCDKIIFPSIRLKEDIVVHPANIAEERAPKASVVPAAYGSQVSAATPTGLQGPSLAELARQTRQAPRTKAQATLDDAGGMAPAGFQTFAMLFCQNPQHCSQPSVIIPDKAEVVTTTNGQYIFKTILNGDPVMLYAGPADVNAPYRSMTNPDYIRMRDLANPNGWSREKTDGVSTQELTIAGQPALMTRFRYQRDPKTWWVGERALIQMPGMQFLVGCTAPEQRFADAETLCTTLVNSLRLP